MERFLEHLESVKGYGGSLEPTLFDKIADSISDIYENKGNYEPKTALEVWNLITNRYELETQYLISEDSQNKGEFLAEGNITEVLVLRVYIEFNQLSGITNNKNVRKSV